MKTPQLPAPNLASAIGLMSDLYLKREDMHHFKSHKGRSIPLMIKEYRKQGVTNFVISSSGNAALAAALCIQEHNFNNPSSILTLKIFVGRKISAEKLLVLRALVTDPNITIEQVEKPKQVAFQLDKSGTAKFLRQSTDDLALEGYAELAQELNRIPNLSAIFIPTSSGTTAQALGLAFKKLNQHPQIHIVQTTSCHPMIDTSDTLPLPSTSLGINSEEGRVGLSLEAQSLATAIVDHVAHRKKTVLNVVNESAGHGWIITNDEIKSAMNLLEQTENLLVSPNSALSVAGLIQAKAKKMVPTGAIVCLITGM